MGIFENAIDSIRMGIEDYETGKEERNISAVRNILAGILLIFKEKLRRLSPSESDKDLLIKEKILPYKTEDGDISFEAKGKLTVNVHSIRERFKSLDIKCNWEHFDKINLLRNELEHYYTVQPPNVIREIIANSFILIRDFLIDELKEDPQKLLGNKCWETMLSITEVYSKEEAACKASIEKVDWAYQSVRDSLKHLNCPKCHSSLIFASDRCDDYRYFNLHCRACQNCFEFADVIESCVADNFYVDAFLSCKDGGESPYDLCPECGKDTFVYSEECCVACGYKMQYRNCAICGTTLRLDEQEYDGICAYHFNQLP